jgi:hypothetical protein
LPSLKRLTLVFTDLPSMISSDGSHVQYLAPFGPVSLRRKRRFTREIIDTEVLRALAEVELVFEASKTLVIHDSSEFLQLFGGTTDLVITANGHNVEFGIDEIHS